MNKEWREMTISEKKDLLVRQIRSDVFDIHNHVCFLLNFCGLPQEKATELSNHYSEIEKIITEYSKKNFVVINDDGIEQLGVSGMREFTSEEIKNRLSNIGEAIGSIALEYIVELEKENEQLKQQIEKMKFCQNCKYGRALSYEEPCLYCSRCFANEGKEGLKDYWELAE